MIKSYTWAKDSHGLYDYENKEINKKSMTVDSSGKFLFLIFDIFISFYLFLGIVFRNRDDIYFVSRLKNILVFFHPIQIGKPKEVL